MIIKKNEDYYFTDSWNILHFSLLGSDNHGWAHLGSDNQITVFTHEQLQAHADNGKVETVAQHKVRLEKLENTSGMLVGMNVSKLTWKPVACISAFGSEHYGVLVEADLFSGTLTFADHVYYPLIGDYEYNAAADVGCSAVAEFREMNELELEDWNKIVSNNTPTGEQTMTEMMKDETAALTPDRKLVVDDAPEVRNDFRPLPKNYRPDLVNSDTQPDKLAKKLKVALAKEDKPDAITILLHGVPGTGKTLTARYVSNELGMPLHSYKISELLDKYVGGSEKAIQKAFKSASDEGAILHIDEIDAISGKRETADRQHQVSSINSVLQALDDFKGIGIFTTNSTDRIDTAIQRRMLLDVEMKNMTSSQANSMSKLFFPRRRIDDLEPDRFAPADFSKTKDALLFVDEDEINKAYLIKQLKRAADTRNGITQADKGKLSMGFNLS